MSMTYTIDPKARLVRLVGTGLLTDDEMVQCISTLRADPRLEPDMNTLSDMREIEMGFTSQGVKRMIDVMEETTNRRVEAKAAIVVSTEVAFGMGRMIEIRSNEQVELRFRIFREMDAAREWLSIE